MIKSPKKLIEVALPLDDINAACAYEKMPGIGAQQRQTTILMPSSGRIDRWGTNIQFSTSTQSHKCEFF